MVPAARVEAGHHGGETGPDGGVAAFPDGAEGRYGLQRLRVPAPDPSTDDAPVLGALSKGGLEQRPGPLPVPPAIVVERGEQSREEWISGPGRQFGQVDHEELVEE